MLKLIGKSTRAMRLMFKGDVLPAAIIIILGAFGEVCTMSTHVYLMEQSLCRRHYTVYEPSMIPQGGLMDEEMCKLPAIQAQVAGVHGVFTFLTFLPALVLTGPYGKLGERLGKKFVLLLNVTSVSVAALFFMAVCYFRLDIRWIYLTPVFDVIGGGSVILSSFLYSYIAESVDAKRLSGVFYNLSAAQLITSFLGMLLSSWLLRSRVWLLYLAGVAAYTFSIPMVFLLHSKPTPAQFSTVAYSLAASDEDSIPPENSESAELLSSPSLIPIYAQHNAPPVLVVNERTNLHYISSSILKQLTHSLSLFRDIFASSWLSRIALLTYFLLMLGTNVRIIFPQWTSITFHFIFAEVSAINSFEMIISGIILLSLPALSSRFLSPRFGGSSSDVDMFVTKASVCAVGVGLLCMGFAPTRVTYMGAITIWALGSGLKDALRSFVTGIMGSQEAVEQLYLGIGMMETLAGMAATAVWTGIFAEVLGMGYWVLRIPFMASAGVMGMVFIFACILERLDRELPILKASRVNNEA